MSEREDQQFAGSSGQRLKLGPGYRLTIDTSREGPDLRWLAPVLVSAVFAIGVVAVLVKMDRPTKVAEQTPELPTSAGSTSPNRDATPTAGRRAATASAHSARAPEAHTAGTVPHTVADRGSLTSSPSQTEPTATNQRTLSPAGVFASAKSSVVVVTGEKQGSGVTTAPEIVVTNCHVVGEGRVEVRFEGRRYSAEIVSRVNGVDLCLLSVPRLPSRPASIAPSQSLVEGERVFSIGNPQGLELTIGEGLVSGIRNTPTGQLIQTTAPISPGSSGGGLFDENGRLIGITSFFLRESQNLNFAISADLIPAKPSVAPGTAGDPLLKLLLEAQTRSSTTAPNGSEWPQTAGYVPGYPVDNGGGASTVTIDNTRGLGDVFVKIYSATANRPVRHIYIPAGEAFTANGLRADTYELHYLILGSGQALKAPVFDLEESLGSSTEYSITLYSVPNGNFRPARISLSEF